MNVLNKKHKLNTHGEGQSLVEFSLVVPLLLLLLLGVFEVGWVLRGYLVLSTANRESARYAIKSGILDFSERDAANVGYNFVVSHTISSIAQQLPVVMTQTTGNNTTMIMTHFVVDTGLPCVVGGNDNPQIPYKFDPNCTPCKADTDEDNVDWFTRDDLILHPGLPGYEYFKSTVGAANKISSEGEVMSITTKLDYTEEVKDLKNENNRLNCNILKSNNVTTDHENRVTANNIFVTEMFFDQPQLLGAPIISNRFTDPIPLYSHTAMRISASRDLLATPSGTSSISEGVGPVCELYPLALKSSILSSVAMGDPLTLEEGTNFNWVRWDGNSPGGLYAAEAVLNPRLALNDFKDGGDTTLSGGNQLSIGTVGNNATLNQALGKIVDKRIMVPVMNGSSSNLRTQDYIAVLDVSSVYTSSMPRTVSVNFAGFEDRACQ